MTRKEMGLSEGYITVRWPSKHTAGFTHYCICRIIKYSATGFECSRTVPGSIPGSVTGFFSDIFPSDRTMALGSTQRLVKMSTRNFFWG